MARGPKTFCTRFQGGTTAALLTGGSLLLILPEMYMERLTTAFEILGSYLSWSEARREAGVRRPYIPLRVQPMVAPSLREL